MGALIRSTFTSTMKKTDTFEESKTSMALTLEGEGEDDKKGSISPSFKDETVQNVSQSDKQINCSCKALGGDVTIFAEKPGGGEDKHKGNARILNKWAKTIPQFMVGFNFKLVPIWTLVEHVNPTFAKDLERELAQFWQGEYDKVKEFKFADNIETMQNHKLKTELKTQLDAKHLELLDLKGK